MKKGFILLTFLLLMVINFRYFVNAETIDTKVYLIFNKKSYEANEEIHLTINLDKFARLVEVKMRIKVDQESFEPIKTKDGYFTLNEASIFSHIITNDYIDQSYLRLALNKEELLDEGYYSGIKNNLCEISFISKKRIENIETIWGNERISLYLFNTFDEAIVYEIKYSDKINFSWQNENYEIPVYSELPNFNTDLIVHNRLVNEYQLYLEQTIDVNKLGLQIILLGLYDKTNADYVIIGKSIVVKDLDKPLINSPETYVINDFEVNNFDIHQIITISDNYDSQPKEIITYYNYNRQETFEKKDFINYLTSNLNGYVTIEAIDSSGNHSEIKEVKVIINDLLPPVINEVKMVEVLDKEIDTFDFSKLITVSDEYDKNPNLILCYYINEKEVTKDTFLSELKLGEEGEVTYYANDINENETEKYTSKIKPKDTTPPVITGINDLIINDTMIYQTDFAKDLTITDNFTEKANLLKTFYIKNSEVSFQDFLRGLAQIGEGIIYYQGIDETGNKGKQIKQVITINDTTPPQIEVINLKDGGKYPLIKEIIYEVNDNIEGEIETVIYLNEEIYNGSFPKEVGKYQIKIVATDKKGNEQVFNLSCYIIEDNIIGCGDDVDCYFNNYFEIVIIACSLLAMIIAIIVGKIILKVKKKESKRSI